MHDKVPKIYHVFICKIDIFMEVKAIVDRSYEVLDLLEFYWQSDPFCYFFERNISLVSIGRDINWELQKRATCRY